MLKKSIYLLISASWIFVWFYYRDDISFFLFLSGTLFTFYLLQFIDNISKRILILDLIELLAIAQWLFFPFLYYLIQENTLVEWQFFYLRMQVPANDYFALAFPSTVALLIGINYYKFNYNNLENNIIKLIKNDSLANGKTGLYLILLGVFSLFFQTLNIRSLDFIMSVMNDFFYVGILYIYYSKLNYRTYILIFSVFLTAYSALNGGMFGGVIWWPLLIVIIISVGKKIKQSYKVSFLIIAFFALSVLQIIKAQYRDITWKGVNVEESNTEVLNNLISTSVNKQGFSFFSLDTYYPIIGRMNQGYHVTMAQKYTPAVEPFCYGETLATALLSTIIPRFLWEDKPKAGGKVNYQRFTGIALGSASMNIGQLGDAYVNFTTFGAPFVLFFYGLLLSYIYKISLAKARRQPPFLLWLPLLFFQTLNVETDFLTTVNGVFKSALICFAAFYIVTKIK